MLRLKRSTLLGVVAAAVVVVATATIAFACTTYVGKMTIKGNANPSATSVAQGNNNCDVSCGASNGSMKWCGLFTLGAQAHATNGTVTVTMGTTDVCNGEYGHGENHLTPNATYDINYRAGDHMTSSDTTVVDANDCMSWTIGNGTVRLGTALADSNGAFTKTVNLTSPTSTNSAGKYAGICVDDPSSLFGNQTALQVVT